MPTVILMPALSPTMSEGILARWLKNEGEAVKAGEVLAEIETDKATMEFESAEDGILAKILVPGGTHGVKVNQPIALMVEEGEDASRAVVPVAAPEEPPPPPAPPAPAPVEAAPPPAAAEKKRVFASPLARRLAAEAGLTLGAIRGSGPHGRVVKADVEAAAASPKAAPPPPPPAGDFGPAYEEIPNSSMRKVIARRLTEAKQAVPHFYLTIDCRVDALLDLRGRINHSLGDGGRVSLNDMVVKAVALALRKVPAANAAWGEEAVRRFTEVDVSVAVATPGGLITPVLRQADRKTLAALSAEMRDLAARARGGRLELREFQGGGFTISNLGMYGIRQFAAIVNPPQGCILAVGAAEQRPVVQDGALAVATVMTCTLSVDHRVVDGAVGAEFLAAFKGLVEDPLLLLL